MTQRCFTIHILSSPNDPLTVIPTKAGIQLFPFFVMPVQTGIHNPVRHAGADRYPVFINFPSSRPPPGRRGSAPLFISGFRLGPCRNDSGTLDSRQKIAGMTQRCFTIHILSSPNGPPPFVISEWAPDRHTGADRYP